MDDAMHSRGEQAAAALARSIHLSFLAALSIALLASLWSVEYIPTNDGANAVVYGYLDVHFGDSSKGYADFLEQSTSVTSIVFNKILGFFIHFLPWRDALRTTLSLGALLWAWSFALLAWTLHPRRFGLGAFGFATALSWPFYMGFFSFWLASGLALLVLSFGVRRSNWSPARLAVLGAGTLLVGLSHVFASLVLGLCLLGLALSRGRGRQRLWSVLALGIASLPTLLVAALVVTAPPPLDPVSTAVVQHAFRPTWLDPGETLMLPWICFTTGPWWRGVPSVLLAIAGLIIATRRTASNKPPAGEKALALVALILLLSGLVLPFHIETWKFFSPRFLPFAVALGLVLLPLERVTRPTLALGFMVGTSLFALAAISWSALHHHRLVQHDADTLAGLQAPVRRSGARLPIRLRAPLPGVAHADAGLNLGHLYILDQGGMVPYLFATRPTIHPYLYKAKRRELFGPFPGRFFRQLYKRAGSSSSYPPAPVQLTSLAQRGAAYEDVILMGEAHEADAFLSRGYVADFRRDGVAILRYVGCGLRVEVVTEPEFDVPIFVEYGWAPILGASDRRILRPDQQPKADLLRAFFPKAPCGRVWIRMARDTDRSGDLSQGDFFYQEAGPLGLILKDVTREKNSVRLHAGPTPDDLAREAPSGNTPY
jgi:hypothetical protein